MICLGGEDRGRDIPKSKLSIHEGTDDSVIAYVFSQQESKLLSHKYLAYSVAH